jgi:lysozyme
MKTNKSGVDLIKRWEGCRLKAYPDPATGGEPWTIGYGLTSAAGIVPVKRGLVITQAQADEYLVKSLVKYEAAVSKALTKTPTPNQFAAMVSLCFNVGPGAFARSSVVRKFNAGDTRGAADAFRLWNKAAGKVMAGLKNRREDERKLFLTS